MQIGSLLRTATIRQSIITSGSTILNGILGAIFYFLVARLLGSTQYGEFTLATTTITLLSGIVDLGMSQGLVKYVAQFRTSLSKHIQLANFSLRVKTISGAVTGVAILMLSDWIVVNLLEQPGMRYLLPLMALGVITHLLFSFSSSYSQALEKFWLWGGLMVGSNLFRLLMIFFILQWGAVNAFSTTLSFVIPPLLGFVISLFFFSPKLLFATIDSVNTKELFNFNKWVTSFVILSTISSRIDTYLTAKLIDLSATGIYSLAGQIVTILPQLTIAFGVVTAPKFSSFSNPTENVKYTLKSMLLTTTLAIGSSLLLIPLGLFVIQFSGSDFNLAIVPFLILLISMAIFLAGSPIRDSILYYLGKPKMLFLIVLGHMIVVLAGGWWLIPQYQIVGSALTSLLGQVFILVASLGYFVYENRRT